MKINSSFLRSFSPTFPNTYGKVSDQVVAKDCGTRMLGLVLAVSCILRVLIQGLAVATPSLLLTDTCCLCLHRPSCLGLAVVGQLSLLPGQIRW